MDEDPKNMAVFVVRHHRGPNLGPIRFDIIKDVAREAIKKVPTSLEAMLNKDMTEGLAAFSLYSKDNMPRLSNRHARGASVAARKLAFQPSQPPSAASSPESGRTRSPITSVQV